MKNLLYFTLRPKQALEVARLSGANQREQKEILDAVALRVPTFPLRLTPPEMARIIHGIVREITKNSDPYAQLKKKSNALALSVYPQLTAQVSCSPDRLL